MKQRKNKQKQVRRCDCCNKIVNGQPVVLAKHAIDYVKKQGFEVIHITLPWAKEKSLRVPLQKTFVLLFALLLLIPFSTAAFAGGLTVDFTKDINIYILLASFVFAAGLFFLKQLKWTAFILILDGIIMMMNDINYIFALMVMFTGIIIATLGGKA